MDSYWHAVEAPVYRKLGGTNCDVILNVVKYNPSNKTYFSKSKITDFKNYLKKAQVHKKTTELQ